MLFPPSPFTKYGNPFCTIRSYVWSWPFNTAVAPHAWNGHCIQAELPCVLLDEYGG